MNSQFFAISSGDHCFDIQGNPGFRLKREFSYVFFLNCLANLSIIRFENALTFAQFHFRKVQCQYFFQGTGSLTLTGYCTFDALPGNKYISGSYTPLSSLLKEFPIQLR